MEQFLEKNQNPVMSVGSEGMVLYSNKASEPLLQEWGVAIGEKLPSSIADIVQKVITQNNPEKIEVKAGKRVYLVVFHPLPKQECVNITGFDISDYKELEGKLQGSDALERTNLELTDIIDIKAVQSLMNDFYKLSHITMALVDLKGNVLLSVGWQDVCTKFHRVCPETCKHCMESDTILSSGVSPGEFKLYKCKNNMWDIATPIIVGSQHVGNAFSGQFFFEDEPLDYELFRSQARQYGFNEEEYIAALEKVPRLSREDVNTGMSFVMTFANMVSQLGYSNLKLAKSLAERNSLVDALQENRKDLDRAQAVGNLGSWRLNVHKNELMWSDEVYRIFGIPKDTPLTYETFLSTVHPDDREYVNNEWKAGLEGKPYDIEHRIIVDSKVKWVREKAYIEFDNSGMLLGGFGIVQDITERKEANEALKKAHDNLEKIIEERTSELEKAYNSLKESEKSLSEAQKMAHIGNWEWEIATDKAHWSDELYRIYGRNPQESGVTYKELFDYVHPDDKDYVANAIKALLEGKPYGGIDYRMILPNGEERTVHAKGEVVFDEKNIPIRIKGITQDITERKKAEERIQSLANVVESSQDAIVTMSLDGIISSWNKGAEQAYGYSAEEILRKSVSILAPDNLKDEPKKLIDRVKHGINIKNYETSRLKKDGTLITVSITFSPVFDIHGKLTYISAIYRDITERKKVEEKLRESEEKYRNIVETANELILTTDNENVITYVNKKIVDMLGYTTEEFIGRPICVFISEEYRPIFKLNLEKRRQGISGSYELKLIRKDGSPLWTFLNAKPLFDKEGKYVGAMSMFTDITERKKTEETLTNIETTRKKEIHHRIKNNLQVISSLLDLQADKFDNPKVIEAFRESQDRIISMALIHEELYKGERTDTLDFSTYIRELAENLFRTYRYSAKNIHLSMDLEENAFFDMDTAVPLGIIINELVLNSLKHAFQGRDEGEIRIMLRREESEGSKSTSFVLIVSDNGVGIPENLDIEDLDSLGIQLINTLVEQLEGELEFKRNNGTEFVVSFTVREE